MADATPNAGGAGTGTGTPGKTGSNIMTRKIGGMPVWAWGLIVAAGVGVGLYFVKKQQANTTPAASTANSPAQAAIGDTTQTPSSMSVPNTTGDQVYIVAPPTPVTTTGSTTPAQTYTIRQSGKDPAYDSQFGGVPLRSTPGGSELLKIPWGASVTASGGAVAGPNNLPANSPDGTGSNTWYPVLYNAQLGYISAWDLIGVGSGGPVSHRYQSNALAVIGEY